MTAWREHSTAAENRVETTGGIDWPNCVLMGAGFAFLLIWAVW